MIQHKRCPYSRNVRRVSALFGSSVCFVLWQTDRDHTTNRRRTSECASALRSVSGFHKGRTHTHTHVCVCSTLNATTAAHPLRRSRGRLFTNAPDRINCNSFEQMKKIPARGAHRTTQSAVAAVSGAPGAWGHEPPLRPPGRGHTQQTRHLIASVRRLVGASERARARARTQLVTKCAALRLLVVHNRNRRTYMRTSLGIPQSERKGNMQVQGVPSQPHTGYPWRILAL